MVALAFSAGQARSPRLRCGMATPWRIHVVHDANVRDTLRRIRSRSSCRSMSSLQESGMDPEPEDDEGAWDLFRFVRSALILVPIVAGAGAMMTLGIWREHVNLVSSEDCIHPTAVTVRDCRYRDVFPTELMALWLVERSSGCRCDRRCRAGGLAPTFFDARPHRCGLRCRALCSAGLVRGRDIEGPSRHRVRQLRWALDRR